MHGCEDRDRLLGYYRHGVSFDSNDEMHEEIEDKIKSIVAQIAKRDDHANLPAEADIFTELGVSSVAGLDLLLTLEEAFGVSIPDEAFGDARTISRLTHLIRAL